MTDSMRRAIGETDRRRAIQQAYNDEHGITPASIVKAIDEVHRSVYERDYLTVPVEHDPREAFRTEGELRAAVAREEAAMKAAAADLDFERAAALARQGPQAAQPAARRGRLGGSRRRVIARLAQGRAPRGAGVRQAVHRGGARHRCRARSTSAT